MTFINVYLDTQVIVWLYGDPQRAWPAPARQLLSTGNLRFAPMVRLELRYLHEIGRLKIAPEELLAELSEKLDLVECELPFGRVVDLAKHITWTRDPFAQGAQGAQIDHAGLRPAEGAVGRIAGGLGPAHHHHAVGGDAVGPRFRPAQGAQIGDAALRLH